jgi:rRNA biogenesis protein RRP5
MVKKFKHSSKAWIAHFKNIALHNEEVPDESAKLDLKEVLTRALQCLKKHKHIVVLTNYAKLMYEQGEAEKGRSTLEAIVSNYPKR